MNKIDQEKVVTENLTHRKATIQDLEAIIQLLLEDDLGQTRETLDKNMLQNYIDAFYKIELDPNQYLMIVQRLDEVVGTCHLTIIPSLTFKATTRMQIEAVRVSSKYRGHKIGQWMLKSAIEYGKSRGALIVQLTTNTQRPRAMKFYEQLGFKATHAGMKVYLEN